MDALQSMMQNWDACHPQGVYLPATSLGRVLELVSLQLQAPSVDPAARADAAGLLNVSGSGLPPILRLLRVSGRTGTGEVIHFFRFWQAFQEVTRRLRGMGSQEPPPDSNDVEPIAEEITEFRDRFLRRLEKGFVTQAMEGFISSALIEEDIDSMLNMSADAATWAQLQAELRKGSTQEQVQVHTVCEVVLSWLRKVCTAYSLGHAADIRGVCSVARCGRREACLHLAAAGWDVEVALRGLLSARMASSSTALASPSWSSQGARLQQDEVECPICMHPYDGDDHGADATSRTQLQCCFQVLCRKCYSRLVDEQQMITCPFCRVVDHVPRVATSSQQGATSSQQGSRRRSGSLGRICQTAERLADGARRVLGARPSPARQSLPRGETHIADLHVDSGDHASLRYTSQREVSHRRSNSAVGRGSLREPIGSFATYVPGRNGREESLRDSALRRAYEEQRHEPALHVRGDEGPLYRELSSAFTPPMVLA